MPWRQRLKGGFFAGLALGIILGAGAGTAWFLLREPRDAKGPVVAVAADAGPAGAGKSRKKRRPARPGRNDESNATDPGEDEEIPVLTAADRKLAADGDVLRPGERSVDLSAGAPEPRDLSQGEIDGAIAGKAQAIIRCITDARGNAPLSGRVTVGVVVRADGGVSKTRVEAPAYLIDNALGRCVRPKLQALRFPATGKETVVTVPFDVE